MTKEQLEKRLTEIGKELYTALHKYQEENNLPWKLPTMEFSDGTKGTPPLAIIITAYDSFFTASLRTTNCNEKPSKSFNARKEKEINLSMTPSLDQSLTA